MHVEGEGQMDGESECFKSLDEYMKIAEQIRRFDPQVDTIILTSEDKRYLEQRHKYEEEEKEGRWRFLVNPFDLAGKTGSIGALEKEEHQSMEEVFLSLFSTLHLQLNGKYFILNCSSNYHQLIKKLVKLGGCSPTTHPVLYCLHEQYAENHLCTDVNEIKQCREARDREIKEKIITTQAEEEKGKRKGDGNGGDGDENATAAATQAQDGEQKTMSAETVQVAPSSEGSEVNNEAVVSAKTVVARKTRSLMQIRSDQQEAILQAT